jgi:hypothetical protein
MKKTFQTFIAVTLVSISAASAQTNLFKTINETDLPSGWMVVREATNVSTIVSNASSPLADLTATFDTSTNVTFGPATATNALWYNPPGGIGSSGNKLMQAYLYGQETGTFAGDTLQFSGLVTDYTLSTNVAGVPYSLTAYIRDTGPGGAVSQISLLIDSTGEFNLSLPLNGTPGRTVQWGLLMQGRNILPNDIDQLETAGSVSIQAIPEPSTYALIGLAALGGLVARGLRRKA